MLSLCCPFGLSGMQSPILKKLSKKPFSDIESNDIQKINDQIIKEGLTQSLEQEMKAIGQQGLSALTKLSATENADEQFSQSIKELADYARITPNVFCTFWTAQRADFIAQCETEISAAQITLKPPVKNHLLRAQKCQEFLRQFDKESNILCKPNQATIIGLSLPNAEKRRSRQLLGIEAGLQAYDALHSSEQQDDKDTLEVKGYLKTLITGLNKPESGEEHGNVMNAYNFLRKFYNHDLVHKQWANSRLICLALAKCEEKSKEKAWQDKKATGSRLIANDRELKEQYLRAIANHLETKDFNEYIKGRISLALQSKTETPKSHSHRSSGDKKEKKHHHKTPRD